MCTRENCKSLGGRFGIDVEWPRLSEEELKVMNKSMRGGWYEIGEELQKQAFKIIDSLNKELERQALANMVPPIKGDITPGKLKWRGIRLCISPEGKWFEQRGKRITSIYETNRI